MLCVISIFISLQKIRRGPGWSRKLWPKNAHADTLVEGQMFAAKDHEEFEAFATGLFSNRPLVFIDEYCELYVVYV